MNRIEFDDLTPIQEEVLLGGKKYVIREWTGDAACRYENARMEKYEYTRDEDGNLQATRIKDLADLEPLLVSLCLFQEDNEPVPLELIRSWPTRVVVALYNRIREVNGMNLRIKEREELTKN